MLASVWKRMLRVKPHCQGRTRHAGKVTARWLAVGGLSTAATFGVFVVTGQVATVVAGSAAVPSLLVAAVASLLAGLCLAEFVASQPEGCSSVYSGCYHSTAEVVAFAVGWMSVLQYAAALAATCRVLSAAVNYLAERRIQDFLLGSLGSVRPDMVAVCVILLSTAAVAVGLPPSRLVATALVLTTAASAVFFVVLGAVYSESREWSDGTVFLAAAPNELLTGAAILMYAFLGPHCLTWSGQESERPHRDLPVAIGAGSALSFLVCFSIAVVLSVLVRNASVHTFVPLVEACEIRDINWARYVLGGATVACTAVLALEAAYPLHHVATSMAQDGLLFRTLSKPWPVTGVPSTCVMCGGLVTVVFALLLDVVALLKVMASGPLFVNSVVCVAVLLYRYQPHEAWRYEPVLAGAKSQGASPLPAVRKGISDGSDEESSETDIDAIVEEYKEKLRVAALTHLEGPTMTSLVLEPTVVTARRAALAVLGLLVSFVVLSLLVTIAPRLLTTAHPFCIAAASCTVVVIGALLTVIARQPQNSSSCSRPTFRVPLMPWVPAIAALINVCLLVELLPHAWVPLVTWTLTGTGVYFLYGIHRSTAATSFYTAPSSAQHLSLQPFPRHGKSFISQIVPSHRKSSQSQRHLADLDTILIEH